MTDLYDYLESHSSAEPEQLRELYRQSNIHLLNGRMCSGALQGRLLTLLTKLVRPQRALELGTFTGYSALCIAEGLEEGSELDTVEVDDELEDFIRRQLAQSPHGHRVKLHIGDAMEVVARLGREEKRYGLVYMDADKRSYSACFEAVWPLVEPGGCLLADNTLWGGHVLEPLRHGDAQTRGVMDFNDMIARRDDLEAVMLPLRDGLTIIRKK